MAHNFSHSAGSLHSSGFLSLSYMVGPHPRLMFDVQLKSRPLVRYLVSDVRTFSGCDLDEHTFSFGSVGVSRRYAR